MRQVVGEAGEVLQVQVVQVAAEVLEFVAEVTVVQEIQETLVRGVPMDLMERGEDQEAAVVLAHIAMEILAPLM